MIKWIIKTSTSKQITWFVLIGYATQVGISMLSLIKFGIDISALLLYTTPLITLVLGSYFLKSYNEKVNLPINTTTTETVTSNENKVPTEITTTTETVNTDSTIQENSQG